MCGMENKASKDAYRHSSDDTDKSRASPLSVIASEAKQSPENKGFRVH